MRMKYFLAVLFVFALVLSGTAFGQAAGAANPANYVSTEGITIPDGTQGAPEGFAREEAMPGREATDALAGEKANYLLKFTGAIACSSDGKVATGTIMFKPTRIMSSKEEGTWILISSFTLDQEGFLIITDASGAKYRIKFGPQSGTITELVTVSPDTKSGK